MTKSYTDTKQKNIIDMAITFSAMTRVFEAKSIKRIRKKLYECIKEFSSVTTKDEFKMKHEKFCEWFINNIKTSKKTQHNKLRKVTFGQAAKVLDVVLKVYIYYCNLPSDKVSSRIMPWLNGAIDTKILKKIKPKSKNSLLTKVKTIADIDKGDYKELQEILNNKSIKCKMFPVQYEDVLWRKLNRLDK